MRRTSATIHLNRIAAVVVLAIAASITTIPSTALAVDQTPPAAASAADEARASDAWQAVLAAAEGQTVYFAGWGGAERINRYVAWAAGEMQARYGVTVEHVRVADIAEAVATILAERSAGRDSDGAFDVLWINGENFAAMRRHDLLGDPFVEDLPNFALVDTVGKPTTLVDFAVPTDGLEAPWGMAQLVFMADTAFVEATPRTLDALVAWAADNPGRFTYPQPPDFLGTTFLKQILVTVAPDRDALSQPVDDAAFEAATAPVWAMLDALHPHLWRGGAAFPQTGPALLTLLDDSEIAIAFTFNPGEASAAIAAGQLPDTVRSFTLDGGTLGNTHFLAIPYNASARAGALVLIDFLMSPEAQARKQDPAIWGDPTVLALDALAPEDRALFDALDLGPATLAPEALGPALPEPHPSWVDALEDAWRARYLR